MKPERDINWWGKQGLFGNDFSLSEADKRMFRIGVDDNNRAWNTEMARGGMFGDYNGNDIYHEDISTQTYNP